jgi:hypothetical protein
MQLGMFLKMQILLKTEVSKKFNAFFSFKIPASG